MKNNAAVKRFLPLVLMVGLWLVVLLVPALDLLFRVQLGGSPMTQFSAWPSRRDVPNFWEKSARRFPDNIPVLWQAAGEYPVSEEPEEEDAEYSGDEDEILISPVAPPAPPGLPGSPPPPPAPTPTPDPSLPKSQVFPGKLEGVPEFEKLRRLDLLITHFPNNADLIAARLRATIGSMRNGRIGGEMSDAKLEANRAAGIPSPERSQEKPNYTVADLNKLILLAQRGGQLEPDNGFFDWMQCCFLIYGWRDDEAWQALDAAAGKKRFDDHTQAEQNARLEALSTVFNRKLLMEEKLHDYYESVGFPQYARYREMARIISWQSVKAQRKGDHKSALRIIAGLGRTAARMRENSKSFIEGLVAIAIESIAWGSATYDSRASNRGNRRRITPNQQMSSFQSYATKNGRPELAAEAGRNYTESAKFRTRVTAGISNGSSYGTPFWVFILITLLWIAGVLLLLLLPLSLLMPAILVLLSRIPRLRGVLRLDESGHEEIPSPREIWNGALACGGLRALGTALCGAIVVGLAMLSFTVGLGQAGEISKTITTFWDDVVSDGGSFNGIEGVYYLLVSSRAPESYWRWVVALSPLLFGVLFAAWRATEWQKVQNGEHPFKAQAFLKSLLQGHAFRAPSGERDDLDVPAAFLKLSDWFLMLMLIGAWYTLATIQVAGTSEWLIPLTLVLLFSGGLLVEKIAIWRQRPRRRQALRYGLRLWQRSLLAWLVLGSALYFVLLLVSLPLRAHAEQGVERVLRLGEVGASQDLSP